MLPHPELPALSRAAAAAEFLGPEAVFESGRDAVLSALEPSIARPPVRASSDGKKDPGRSQR